MIPFNLVAPLLNASNSLAPNPKLFNHIDCSILLRISQRFGSDPLVHIFLLLNYIIYFVAYFL